MSVALVRPTEGKRYERQGILAIEPKAFLDLFFGSGTPENELAETVETVFIRGPLDHHDDGWCDSYDAILRRVKAACEGAAQTIVLRIDSPGGDVMGCFETARAISETAKAAGKTLLAHTDGCACSAAYALACSADRIFAAPSARLGSIGVIATRGDFTGMDEKFGVKFSVVTSGARKADGHPSVPITPAELAELQRCVDAYAAQFFELVAERRGGLDAASLEAAVFAASDAKGVRLADEVMSFEALLAKVASGGLIVMSKYDEGRAALEEAAKGEGEEAEKAKRALAAMDEDPEDKPVDDGAESEGEGDGDEDPPKDEDEDEEEATAAKSRSTVSASTAGELASQVSTLRKDVSALKLANEAGERKAILASRPDLDSGLAEYLSTKPLAEVKAIVSKIKKPPAPKPAAAASVTGTRGEGQGAGTDPRAPHATDMDRAMGLASGLPGIRREGTSVVYGVISREEAAARVAKGAAK